MHRVVLRFLPLLFLSVLIAACGGGGGGSDAGSSSSAPSYTVGGTVSGLAGNGLMLQNNAGNDLAVTTSGTFTFSTALSGGSAYAVSVKTQPTNKSQNCVVTNGSGAVGSTNVANVNITCTTQSFAVGGTVSGLAGTGLVLRNNNGDDLAINANGAFNFATAIDSGAAYNVTLQTQPTAQPSQTCTVTNSTGTVTASAVTSVSISCRALTAKFLYVPNVTANSISGYAVDAMTGALTPLQGSPFAGATGTPALYTVVPVLSPNGQFLYTLNAVNSGTVLGHVYFSTTIIMGYQVNSVSGQLSPLSGFPITLPAAGGNELLFSPSGNYAFFRGGAAASTSLGIYAFQHNPTTGSLVSLPSSPFAAGLTSVGWSMTPSGKFLYVTRQGSTQPFIDIYSISATTGALSLITNFQETSFNLNAALVDPAGKLLAISTINPGSLAGNTVHLYLIDGATGQPTLPAASIDTNGYDPFFLLFDPTGKSLYASNYGNNITSPSTTVVPGPGSIAAFSVNPTALTVGGLITNLSGSPHATNGNSSGQPSIDPTGKYLAVTNFDSGTVAAFKINPTTKALTAIAGSFVPPVVAAPPTLGNFVFDPSGKYGYIVDRTTNSVSVYSINATTDSTTLVGMQPTGVGPSYMPIVVGLH